MIKDYQRKIINLLIDQELTLSSFYKILAHRSSKLKTFWAALSAEEIEHASWIQKVKKNVEEGNMYFHEDNMRTYTLQTFLKYLNKIIEDAKKGTLSVTKALSLALSVEESLIEKNAFHHFEGDSPEIKRVLKALREGAEEHLVVVREMWHRYQ